MKNLLKPVSLVLYFSLMLWSVGVSAESLEDKRSTVSPTHIPGMGEYMHGQGHGKLMIRVLVLGAVPQQGIHYVPEGTDLIFAMMYCGGKTELTTLNGITIRRRGMKNSFEVDLEDMIADGDPIPKLQDGDVIEVPFSWRKDFQTILTVTGFVTSLTSFALSLIALTRTNR